MENISFEVVGCDCLCMFIRLELLVVSFICIGVFLFVELFIIEKSVKIFRCGVIL